MAGFKRDRKYHWIFDFGAFYYECEATSKEAFRAKSILLFEFDFDDVPTYCNGKLI